MEESVATKQIVVTGFGGLLLLLAGISIMGVLRRGRISTRTLREADLARSRQRELSAHLLATHESERKAVSRDLNEKVGQALSGLLLGIGHVAATVAPGNEEETRSQLRELRRVAEKTVEIVRDMSLMLRPSMLDDLGLIPAVEWRARETSRTSNISVDVRTVGSFDGLPEEHKICIYRVVQEALENVARHANARHVEVTLAERPASILELTVEDDGRGFKHDRQKGLGLFGIEERVTYLRGSLHLASQPGEGTLLRVKLPLASAESPPSESLAIQIRQNHARL